MAVITIRHEFATGGRELGQMVAARLGYQYVDKNLFQKIADNLSVSNSTLKSFENSRHMYITNLFLGLVSKNYIKRISGHDRSVVCDNEYQNSLKALITKFATKDNVVILGRAACYFLKNADRCYRFRVFAPMEWRERYAVEKLKIPANKVKKVIAEKDESQRWFFKMIYGNDYNDRYLYHVNLNMGLDSLERSANILFATAGLEHSSLPGSYGEATAASL
jgi:cytidylate kinase